MDKNQAQVAKPESKKNPTPPPVEGGVKTEESKKGIFGLLGAVSTNL
jgi:hypothetical protein